MATGVMTTPEQILLVRRSWAKVASIQEQAARLFYARLFELDPQLKPLFKGDMAEQGRKLMGMVGMAVAGLERLDSLIGSVRDMGRRHAGYGVRDQDYATVGAALIWTLEQGLGADFDAATRAAWSRVYGLLADTMREAAAELV